MKSSKKVFRGIFQNCMIVMKYDFTINEYINNLNVKIPPEEEFKKIAEIFKIYPNESKQFALRYFERGMLLYGLISKFKPKTILEIGRAQGYSTMCMAWSLYENNIDGRIISVDPISLDQLNKWLIDWDVKYETKEISTKEIWSKYAKPEWLEKIQPLTCFADELLEKNDLPKMDFAFIDGHHIYDAVLADFNIFLKFANKKFFCLFDDYIDDKETRMNEAIDQILEKFDGEIIKANSDKKDSEEVYMCMINNNYEKIDFKFSKEQILKYRKVRKRFMLRKKINRIFPVLDKIKFSKIIKN